MVWEPAHLGADRLVSYSSVDAARKIYVESHGCAANKFDLEIMLAHLINAGYQIVKDAKSADILLVNTCGVKKPTEDRMLERLRLLNGLGKPLIIAGCLPKINLKAILNAAPSYAALLDPQSVDRILLAVRAVEKGERNITYFSDKPVIKLEQPKLRLNEPIEIVQISEGCTGSCSFCCVRFARGALFSYPREMIVDRVRRAVSEGAKEIWITSQDNGAYGLDLKMNLVELLKECCAVEGRFLMRIGMMNPDHALRMLHGLIEVYKNDKVFKFLHLPVQSGDDETLRCMKRFYTVEEFRTIVYSFREKIPEITLATDVICGFPSETPEAFERTASLIEEVQPDIVNISKFFPRPKTPAEKMKQLDIREVKRRSLWLTEVVKRISFDRNRRWLGWEGEVLIDEKGKNSSWIGRNFAYKPIVIKSNGNLLGRFIHAKIVKAHQTYLEARIIE